MNIWQISQDSVATGMSSALAYKAQAVQTTPADQMLGDMTMRQRVTTALGISKRIALQPTTAGEQAVSTQLDIRMFPGSRLVGTFVRKHPVTKTT